MKKIILATACGVMCIAVPALAFNPLKGPPTRVYYAGGSGSGMKARFVVQLPYTYQGYHFPAEDDGVTVRDCHGSNQYVFGPSHTQGRMGYPHGHFSDSGRGAVENRQGEFLHHYKHLTDSGTINGKTGSITYQVAGCRKQHRALKAKSQR